MTWIHVEILRHYRLESATVRNCCGCTVNQLGFDADTLTMK